MMMKKMKISRKMNLIKDINQLLPKIPGMKWGAITNLPPTRSIANEFNRMLPHDKKWHEILNAKDSVWVDGHRIQRKTMESMT